MKAHESCDLKSDSHGFSSWLDWGFEGRGSDQTEMRALESRSRLIANSHAPSWALIHSQARRISLIAH